MARFLKSRAGAAKLGTPLMIACFAAMGGFVYWLSISAKSSEEIAAGEEMSATEEEARNAVSFADFSMDPSSYAGQSITVEGVPVVSLLGAHSFWTLLQDTTSANAINFLVHLGPDALSDSVTFQNDDALTVTGMVEAMSDSVLDSWEASGAFTQEVDRFVAEVAEEFFEAVAVEMHSDSAEAPGEPMEPSS